MTWQNQEIAMYPFLFLSLQDTCITLMRNKLNNTSSIISSTRLRMSDVNEYGLFLCAPVDCICCVSSIMTPSDHVLPSVSCMR